ncbi:MAG: hypothetical protein ACOWWO_08655 [Peptococcaceae bacterium]
MWEYLIARLSILLTFCFGVFLIVLFPLLKKENNYFAWFGLLSGCFVLLVLLYFVFGSPVIREQIFRYGFQ